MYDVIPDIHGQSCKLTAALKKLGYVERNGAWRHSDPNQTCVFLGDYIDRGPDNAGVVSIVRRMVDAGTAQAILGNHELNAIHFHTRHPESGEPLREHSAKNLRQHDSFLKEFPLGGEGTRDVIDWMKTLPLFLEFDHFRAVHASWNERVIDGLREVSNDGTLGEEQLVRSAVKGDPLYHLVEITTKGPEQCLPKGFTITDKDGTIRKEIRVKWWHENPTSWADIAISVPDPSQLPTTDLQAEARTLAYSSSAKPVLFGHYWLEGPPILQASNALCLDYSAGKEGPLVSYRLEGKGEALSLDNVVVTEP